MLRQLPERLDKHFFVPMTPEQRVTTRRIARSWPASWQSGGVSVSVGGRPTAFGVKADELATLLDEVFEQPDTKVVIFSQWLRMHELLVRRLQSRHWEHVLFHGGVPAQQRKALVDRFRDDPRCRAFLSTDAGGVGLNLQHASVVRQHGPALEPGGAGAADRPGPSPGPAAAGAGGNFVAQGTIEEGMLSVLKFKKSLFAGVLDGGEKEVFLGGSRLTRSWRRWNGDGGHPQAPAQDPPEGTADRDIVEGNAFGNEPGLSAPSVEDSSPTATGDPWSALLTTGLSILEQLAATSRATAAGGNGPSGQSFVRRDERTGESYLRFPIPSQEVLDRALGAVAALLEGYRK